MSDLNDLFNALSDDNQDEANAHFNSIMSSKIQSAIDSKKVEVAQEIYGEEPVAETEVSDELQAIETETE